MRAKKVTNHYYRVSTPTTAIVHFRGPDHSKIAAIPRALDALMGAYNHPTSPPPVTYLDVRLDGQSWEAPVVPYVPPPPSCRLCVPQSLSCQTRRDTLHFLRVRARGHGLWRPFRHDQRGSVFQGRRPVADAGCGGTRPPA